VHRHTGEVSVVDEGEGAFGYVRLAKPRTGYESGAPGGVVHAAPHDRCAVPIDARIEAVSLP
jgi:hypothetical protein